MLRQARLFDAALPGSASERAGHAVRFVGVTILEKRFVDQHANMFYSCLAKGEPYLPE